MKRARKWLHAVMIFTATWMLAAHAFAASGTLTGQLFFRQGQGNFCPNTRDCTGALYLQSEFDTLVGIPEVKVQLLNSSNSVIGTGATSFDGHFIIQWTTSGSLTNAHTKMILDHKDSRFLIRTASGGVIFYDIQFGITLVNGATQEQGGFFWGNSGSPERFTNIYHGAFRMWANSLSTSNRMINNFTNVSVRADSTLCPTSCGSGSTKRIDLDNGAPFAPQGRIMHEMGHVASQLSDGHKDTVLSNGGLYCYPNSTGDCGWNLGSDEWNAASFEEGLATFIGDLALYNFNATQPHTCLATVSAAGGGACPTGSFNTETSLGSGQPNCSDHGVIHVVRYLWDIYDEGQDSASANLNGCGAGGTVWTDTLGRDLFEFLDSLNNYVKGTDNHQNDEPFNANRDAYDNRDGRRNRDFNWNYKNRGMPANTNSDAQICMNCGWPE